MLLESALDSIATLAADIPEERLAPFLARVKAGIRFETALILESVDEPELSSVRALFLNVHFEDRHPLLAALIDAEYRKVSRAAAAPIIVWTGPKLDPELDYQRTGTSIRNLVERARTRILIAGYHATSETLEAMGIWAAKARGVEVLVMVSGSDLKAADKEIFQAKGIRLESIVSATGDFSKFHAKAIVADGVNAIVGSANFTTLGQNHNVELGLLVEGRTASTIERVLRSYLRDAASTGWTVS